jgi:hypothetical protein
VGKVGVYISLYIFIEHKDEGLKLSKKKARAKRRESRKLVLESSVTLLFPIFWVGIEEESGGSGGLSRRREEGPTKVTYH